MTTVKTILFVENDMVSQTMYQKRLEREGYHVECAGDGQAALDILSDRCPDLVLLDLMLPKVSGADVLKFMQADPRLTTVPVIIFSNAPLTEVPPDSPLAQGTKRLLKSDCTFPTLLGTIQETLARAPELVVVEAGKAGATSSVSAGNGGSKRNGAGAATMPNHDPEPDTGKAAEFLREAAAMIPKIREHSMGYIKAPGSEASQTHLAGLHQRIHLLSASVARAGCARVALLTNAFDVLLSLIMDKPSTVNPSVLQTIAQAVDCLDGLLKNKDGYSLGPAFQARVLVVDDDTVCNHVNVMSLKRANFETVGVKDPAAALELLETTPFDLVVLDVNMPGMTGFDVCEKMRRLPDCKKTPVIFVTAFSNFDNRKQSVLSGGNDFVSKPVTPAELALKVTVNLIKARVQGGPLSVAPAHSSANNGNRSANVPLPSPPARLNQPAKAEAETPEPTNRLMAGAKLDTKSSGTIAPLGMARPEGVSEPTLPSKTSPAALPPEKEEKPGGAFQERLRQSTAALESAKAGLERESAERSRIESQWREQLSAAEALVKQAETVVKGKEARCSELEKELAALQQTTARNEAALKDKEARCGQLEKELTGLKQNRDELQNQFATEQQAVAKSQQEIKEIKANLEKQAAERTRLETEWRQQLDAAQTAATRTETVLKEKEARCAQLEKELTGLRQVRDELQEKFAAEQQAIAKAQHEIKELQAGLGQQTAERMRLESEWREQLNAVKAAASQTEAALKEKEARARQLEKELAGARQMHDELQNKFTTEQQAVAKAQQEIKELQERMQQAGAEMERARTAREQESAKRAHWESECQNLSKAREALNLELRDLRESRAAYEAGVQERQRKLAEGLRENIQLLQLRLQEAESLNGDSGAGSRLKP